MRYISGVFFGNPPNSLRLNPQEQRAAKRQYNAEPNRNPHLLQHTTAVCHKERQRSTLKVSEQNESAAQRYVTGTRLHRHRFRMCVC